MKRDTRIFLLINFCASVLLQVSEVERLPNSKTKQNTKLSGNLDRGNLDGQFR